MLLKSTLQLLRFHFSLFLFPVFLFGLTQVENIHVEHAILLFIILHLLVYPASNGYNSYMDRDTTPIGGLKEPLQPTRQLFYITVVMDVVAVLLAFFVSWLTALLILAYILASRAYSYRGIRLKKYAVIGYLTVIIFQGAVIFFIAFHGASVNKQMDLPVVPMLAASCLIGGCYPLTQIYQHEADRIDNVKTISAMLGVRGTFLFCGVVFALATVLMFITFRERNDFLVFLICMLPLTVFFSWWSMRSWKDPEQASFMNSLRMNVLSAICTTVFFSIILLR